MPYAMCLVWPEICTVAPEFDEQASDDAAEFSFLSLVPHSWTLWRVNIELEPQIKEAIHKAGFAALLTMYDEATEPQWVPPEDLASAASGLKAMMLATPDDEVCQAILAVYAQDRDVRHPVREAFCDDLDVLAKIAARAARLGHRRVALEVGF